MSNKPQGGETTATATSQAAKPWVERYRPKTLDDVSHQTEVVATLQNAVQTGRLPHLLFYGPPGSGKTSVALALCKQLWHPDQWKRRVLELNASDERGISVVRDKIKHFASLAVGDASSGGSGSSKGKMTSFFQTQPKAGGDKKSSSTDAKENDENEGPKYPNPPFKIIILDEADTVTRDAQAALRRIIESHSRITRFILICNYVTRIIEPLASRCAKFRFQPLPPASMKQRLQDIAQHENCLEVLQQGGGDDKMDTEKEEDVLDEILVQAKGDMRRAVTTLQSIHALAAGSPDMKIDKDTIAEIVGVAPECVVDELYRSLFSRSYNVVEKAAENLLLSGYSAQVLLSVLLPKVMADDKHLSERAKAEICIRIAQAEKNMIEGADEYLQLMTVLSLAVTLITDTEQGQ